MAQVKISALTAADPLTGIEEAPFVQGGATKKATTEQIREYVASQPNVFTVTQRIEDAAPALQFGENDTTDQNWEFIGVAGALRLDELDDAFSNTGTHHTFTHGGGTQFGSPTGGDQGAGTVNATGLYQDGVGVPTLDGGAEANFTAMPQVGGDPIVESDSNADGEFTRFSSGLAEIRSEIISVDIDNPVGDLFQSDAISWTHPIPFVSGGLATGGGRIINLGTSALSVHVPESLTGGSSTAIRAWTTSTQLGRDLSLWAKGPWK